MSSMSLGDLIVSLLNAVAWPLVAIVALCMLRVPLSKLILLIEKVRYNGLQVEFRPFIQELTEKTKSLDTVDRDLIPKMLDFDADPRITILASWASVERAIAELAEARHVSRRASTRRQVELLRRADVISDPLASILQDMGAVRNLVAHGQDVRAEDLDQRTVQVYVEAAAYLEATVVRLQQSDG